MNYGEITNDDWYIDWILAKIGAYERVKCCDTFPHILASFAPWTSAILRRQMSVHWFDPAYPWYVYTNKELVKQYKTIDKYIPPLAPNLIAVK